MCLSFNICFHGVEKMVEDISSNDSNDLDSADQQTITWREAWLTALFRPSLANYRSLAKNTSITRNRAYKWVIVSGFLFSLYDLAYNLMYRQVEFRGLAGIAGILIVDTLLSLIVFVILALITNAIAKLFGGDGEYTELIRVIAAFTAPAVIVSSVFLQIPVFQMPLITQIAPVIFVAYQTGLFILSVKAVHRIGWAAATASSIVPVLVFLIGTVGILTSTP